MEHSPQENIVPLCCKARVPQAALKVVKLVQWMCLCINQLLAYLPKGSDDGGKCIFAFE